MSYLYRCTNKDKCGARRALRRKLESYIREPRCRACKGRLSIDKAQMKKNKETTCTCDAFHFPHRAGSSVWCEEHPTGPTDEDYEQRYGGVKYT